MSTYYFDTSALAKLYHSEPGSDRVERIVAAPANRVAISQLAVIELASVLAIKVRTGFLTQERARAAHSQFSADVASQRIEIFSVCKFEFDLAEDLIHRYAPAQRLQDPGCYPTCSRVISSRN